MPIPKNPNSLEIDQDGALEIAKHISKQYMLLLYKDASQVLGRCILQAGLVGKQDSKNLGRMIKAACVGAHQSTLLEAESISREYDTGRLLS